MGLEQWGPPLFHDPMVEEADVWDLSWGKILSDSVLSRYMRNLVRFSPRGSLISDHAEWLRKVFPELVAAKRVPDLWVWADLVTDVTNVGSVDRAGKMCNEWVSGGASVAYWTGGLEFTRSHYWTAKFLMDQEMRVLLGVEPSCYPHEAAKGRGALVDHIVPVSLWSKLFKGNGFVFGVPRPLPEDRADRDAFYRDLYMKISGGQAAIVISEDDKHGREKLGRGKMVVVPHFNYPTTTQLFESYFG